MSQVPQVSSRQVLTKGDRLGGSSASSGLSYFSRGQIDAGRIVRDTLRLFGTYPKEFFLPCLLVNLLLLVLALQVRTELVSLVGGSTETITRNLPFFLMYLFAVIAAGLVGGALVGGTLTHLAVTRHRGQRLPFIRALRAAAIRVDVVIAANLLSALAGTVPLIPSFLALSLAIAMKSEMLLSAWFFLLLIGIPFSVLIEVAFSLSLPAIIVRRGGPAGSLGWSWDMTRGYRKSVFGALFVLGIIEAGLGILPFVFAGILASFELTVAVSAILMSLGMGWSTIASAVVYNLRTSASYQTTGPGALW